MRWRRAFAEEERPSFDDFYNMTFGYIGQFFFMVISPAVGLFFIPTEASIGESAFIYFFIPGLVALYAYLVPFVLSIFFIIFGADFFLFSWLDDALALIIEHWIGNVAPLLILTVFWAYWTVSKSPEDVYLQYQLISFSLNTLIAAYYWNRFMYESVDAIRYLNPEWNKVSPGERLWPSILYLLGLKEYSGGSRSSESSSGAKEDKIDVDIEDDVWTLLVDF